jgi:hypothetical protein
MGFSEQWPPVKLGETKDKNNCATLALKSKSIAFMAHRRSARMQSAVACQNARSQIESFLWHSLVNFSLFPPVSPGAIVR